MTTNTKCFLTIVSLITQLLSTSCLNPTTVTENLDGIKVKDTDPLKDTDSNGDAPEQDSDGALESDDTEQDALETDSDTDSETGAETDSETDELWCEDQDSDDWCALFDCNDGDKEINPDALEIAHNGIDDDCDGETDEIDTDTDSNGEDCYEDIDIVFALDVSTTMSYILATLESEISIVWDAAVELDDNPHFGLVVFVDDFLVVNAGQTYNSHVELQSDFQSWYTHTSSNQQTQSTNTNRDWPENSIDALYAAATEFAWRDKEKTLHVVIHATDDTFLERPAAFLSSVPVLHTYPETVSALQENHVRVASFAAHIGGLTDDINVEPGFFTDYNGQPSIPDSTSGAVFDIDEVGGSISLADAIKNFVLEERCDKFVN